MRRGANRALLALALVAALQAGGAPLTEAGPATLASDTDAVAVAAAGPVASEADRAALAAVLARPEFHSRRFDGRALRQKLLAWWDLLLEALGTAEAERYADLGRSVFFLAAAVALLLTWRALRRRRGATGVGPPAGPPGGPSGLRTSAAGPRAEDAAQALARGDLVAAVRAAFVFAAAALASAGRRTDGPALTGRELVALAHDDRFADLARLHERTVYGRRPVAPDEARRAVALAADLATRATDGAGAGKGRPR